MTFNNTSKNMGTPIHDTIISFELKLTVLYNDFRDIINNNLYSIYSIPSIFVLKRNLIILM